MVFEFLKGLSDAILTPILNPLLNIHPLFAIILVALFISIVSVLMQRKFTDQARLKFLKKETKKLQEEIKKHKDAPEKQLKLNKKMMPIQGEMMRASLKPTLWMMIPFLFVFLWLAAHFAYNPLLPGENFTITAIAETNSISLEAPEGITVHTPLAVDVVDGEASWILSGNEGLYSLTFSADDSIVTKSIRIDERAYEPVVETYKGDIRSISVGNNPLKPAGSLSIFGWNPGWIAVYIFFSLVFSIGLRKWLDVA